MNFLEIMNTYFKGERIEALAFILPAGLFLIALAVGLAGTASATPFTSISPMSSGTVANSMKKAVAIASCASIARVSAVTIIACREVRSASAPPSRSTASSAPKTGTRLI